MNVLVIGATGYLGSAICKALKAAGNSVLGTARSQDAEQKLRDSGAQPVIADVANPDSLKSAAQGADAVIYAVQYNGKDAFEVESAALRALVDALAGTNKTLIFTSGAWIYGSTGERSANEEDPVNPIPLVAHRPELERIVLSGVARGIRAMVIRPGNVYGNGGGMAAMWVQSAREQGAARFVGDGTSHWPLVHIEDLAQLYVRALEKGKAGAIYNAADDTSFTVREMAQAASYGAGKNGAVESWPLEDARKSLGAFADALAVDSRLDSQKARKELGWQTRSSTIIDDLRFGSYATQAHTR